MKKYSFLITPLVYTVIVVSAIFFTGKNATPSVYDTHLATFSSIVVHTKDIQSATKFYTNVLGLKVMEQQNTSDKKVTLLSLPSNEILILTAETDIRLDSLLGTLIPSTHPNITLKIRNGIKNFHKKINEAFKLNAPQLGRIGDYTKTKWGSYFFVEDNDGNKIFFYQAKGKNGNREALKELAS